MALLNQKIRIAEFLIQYHLKGKSHEKVGEIMVWDGSLGPN
jgi:hypothetical protein